MTILTRFAMKQDSLLGNRKMLNFVLKMRNVELQN